MVTLISSFYNESYLLPWWCEWHKDMFDHAVLFDYFSTDNSVKIIKRICPNWEVRKTVNKDWEFKDNDNEYMRAEREFDGYKIVLTTTEFLFGEHPRLPDKKSYFGIPLKRVIDLDPDNKPSYDYPLLFQKHDTYKEPRDKYKRRFLHNHADGKYDVGRHSTNNEYVDIPMLIYKYVFAPWTDEFIQRKIDMKTHMSPKDIERGRGSHHTWDRDFSRELLLYGEGLL